MSKLSEFEALKVAEVNGIAYAGFNLCYNRLITLSESVLRRLVRRKELLRVSEEEAGRVRKGVYAAKKLNNMDNPQLAATEARFYVAKRSDGQYLAHKGPWKWTENPRFIRIFDERQTPRQELKTCWGEPVTTENAEDILAL